MKQLVPWRQKTTPFCICSGLVNVAIIGCGFKCRLKMRPFIQVDLTIDLVLKKTVMLCINNQNPTVLLNIL